MKAFLLSAGLGTRLRPLTDKIPKCLLPIDGKPLLQIWLELMGRHGVSEVVVNTHWFAEKVEQFIDSITPQYDFPNLRGKQRREDAKGGEEKVNGYSLSVNRGGEQGELDDSRITNQQITHNSIVVRLFYEEELLGSGGTIWANREWVRDGEAFFILYGDNLTNVDLDRMWRFHEGHGLPFTLGVFRAENSRACGIAEVDGDGVVTGFVEKPKEPKSDLAAAGVYVADRRIFDFFPDDAGEKRPLDLGFDVIPQLVGQMKLYEIREFLMDIGTADLYEKAQEIYPQITQIDAD